MSRQLERNLAKLHEEQQMRMALSKMRTAPPPSAPIQQLLNPQVEEKKSEETQQVPQLLQDYVDASGGFKEKRDQVCKALQPLVPKPEETVRLIQSILENPDVETVYTVDFPPSPLDKEYFSEISDFKHMWLKDPEEITTLEVEYLQSQLFLFQQYIINHGSPSLVLS